MMLECHIKGKVITKFKKMEHNFSYLELFALEATYFSKKYFYSGLEMFFISSPSFQN